MGIVASPTLTKLLVALPYAGTLARWLAGSLAHALPSHLLPGSRPTLEPVRLVVLSDLSLAPI